MSPLSSFAAEDLPEQLLQASSEEIEGAPFGIVGLNNQGEVLTYNRYEQQLANLSKEEVVGRKFFSEIAPCTNNFMVAERFFEAWESGEPLDARVPYTFTYRLKPTKVELRLIARGQRGWMIVRLL